MACIEQLMPYIHFDSYPVLAVREATTTYGSYFRHKYSTRICRH